MKTLTIAQLMADCISEVKKGNGNKKILISDDDEGNGYHELFFGITSGDNMKEMGEYLKENSYMIPFDVADNISEYVILG